ncbi:hypothetical protein [Rossellomorea marisflavi]|uniref:hypothetical protein n=1 Tax=Rossellomorea marisflavi TaxID=189381 RepID=UPI003F9F7A9E
MSETVHYKGVLKPLEKQLGESLEEQCRRVLGGKELPSYFDNYQEYMLDVHYKDMTIQDGILYAIERESVDPDADMFKAQRHENGEIAFEVRYYNGGCGFEEAIEEALSQLKKQ